ncbi:MAG: helix-turn-helix transcriptional regulator [Lachnospiraceae bacterium]
MEELGKIIQQLRTISGISQEELSEGICSVSTLSRIEWGTRGAGKLLIDALLQRLGRSTDRFWTIMHIDDYNIMEQRRQIEEYILCENYVMAAQELELYQGRKETCNSLHQQFILKCKALLAEKEKNDWKKSILLLKEAVKLTMPYTTIENLPTQLLGREEIILFRMLAEAFCKTKAEERGKQILEALMQNLSNRQWEEEEYVKSYPKIVRSYIEVLKKQKKYQTIQKLSREAQQLLEDNGVIFLLAELMECEQWAINQEVQAQKRKLTSKEKLRCEDLKNWIAILHQLWEKYGDIPEKNMIYATNMQKDIAISNEIIRKCRKLNKLSQDKLSENICTVENLCRIENGKVTPKEKNYQSLMEKMNQAKERNQYFMKVEEYELHGKIRRIERYISSFECEKAALEWEKMRKKIPGDTLENQQILLRYDTIVKHSTGKITWETSLSEYEKALRLTIPEFEQIQISEWPLTRTEVFLLGNMASGYYSVGKSEKANEIYQELWKFFKESEVDVRYRIPEFTTTAYNFGLLEALNGNNKRACEIFEIGLKKSLLAGRFHMSARFLYGLGWSIQQGKEAGREQEAQSYLKQATLLCDILGLKQIKSSILEYYKEQWPAVTNVIWVDS